MFKLIRKAQRQSQFVDEILRKRKSEEAKYETEKSSLPPPFNKQHYAVQGQGGVVITGAALKVMEQNVKNMKQLDYQLPRSDIVTMKSVVEGLSMIHHGEVYIKEVLSHVVCLEVYEPFQYVRKKSNDIETNCYYIIDGTAEVTYDGRHGESLQIFQTDVLYTHSTGEYLGLVSSVGKEKDLAPPSTIYTTETCEFLKIDRYAFHQRIKRLREGMDQEKMEFMVEANSMLKHLAVHLKEELKKFMLKEKYDANEVVLTQGQLSEYVFFLAEGHCTCLKKIYLPAVQRQLMLTIGHVEPGEFFGEERVTHDRANYCNIVSKSPVVCFKIHRGAFEARGSLRNELMRLMKKQKHQFPSTETLRILGLELFKWEMYKRMEAQHNKSVHENRQMILECRNLRHTEENKLCDFMAGYGIDRVVPEEVHAEKLFQRNQWVGDLYSSKVNISNSHPCATLSSFKDDDGDDIFNAVSESDMGGRSRTVSISSYTQMKSPSSPTSLDSRELFRMFKGSSNLTVSATMQSSNSVQRLPVFQEDSDSDEDTMKYVATESEEIVQRAKNEAARFAVKIKEKRNRTVYHPPEEKSVFESEFAKARAQLAISTYRANMMARKLRRTRKQQATDYKKMRTNKETHPTDLSIDVEIQRREAKDIVGDLENNRKRADILPPIFQVSKQDERRCSISKSNKRKKFMRRLSVRLSEGETFLPENKDSILNKQKQKYGSLDQTDLIIKDRSKSFTEVERTYAKPKRGASVGKLLIRRRTISAL